MWRSSCKGTAKVRKCIPENYCILRGTESIAFEPGTIPSTPQLQLVEWKFCSMWWSDDKDLTVPYPCLEIQLASGIHHLLNFWGVEFSFQADQTQEKESFCRVQISIRAQWADNYHADLLQLFLFIGWRPVLGGQLEKIRGHHSKSMGHSCLLAPVTGTAVYSEGRSSLWVKRALWHSHRDWFYFW